MPAHEEISELLDLPESGSGAPTLARLEEALTGGYAEALALDGERLRIERRLGEVARDADGGDMTGLAEELALLAARLKTTDCELAELRALLGPLHDRARAARLELP
jgi:hypothetical protein